MFVHSGAPPDAGGGGGTEQLARGGPHPRNPLCLHPHGAQQDGSLRTLSGQYLDLSGKISCENLL